MKGMTTLLFLAILDLAGAQLPAGALELKMSAPKVMTAGTLTPVRVTLRNQSANPVRVVVEDCARTPFAVVVDGKPQNARGSGCDDRFVRAVQLQPGATTSDEILVALARGRHKIEARYQADPPDEKATFLGPLKSESQSVTVNVAVMEVDY